MKNKASLCSCAHYFLPMTLLLGIVGLMSVHPIRAGLTVDIHTFRYPGVYVSYGYLNTNAIAPAAPLGDYLVSSPNGSQLQFRYDTNGFNYVTGGGIGTSDFDSFMNVLTNGQWSIQVTNSSSTNTYYFNVSATGLDEDLFNAPTITFPANNAQNVSDNPTFTWSGGPIGWLGTAEVNVHTLDYTYYESASLPPAAMSWNTPNAPLPLGTNQFSLVYISNATASIVASIPRDTSPGSNAISGWVSTANIDVRADQIEFNVVGSANPFDVYLVARYDFENTNSPGRDSSGNDNDADCGNGNGGTNIDTFSTDAAVHTYAREYFGDTGICFTDGGSAFPNMSNALAGSFTVTAWVKTTATAGFDNDDAESGMPILAADNQNINSTTPLSITGAKAAFTVRDVNGDPLTIHSTTTVNDGNYHFLAVTRNRTTGAMNIYVDGSLEASDTGSTEFLDAGTGLSLAGGNNFYEGLVDDVRIYSTELTAGDVAVLAGISGELPLADALDTTNLVWTTGGDVGWFSQTTNTHDTVDAAQSGAIGDDQSSWIETTVTGPGTLSFWWRVDSDDSIGYDYLEVYFNGNSSSISGDSGWQYYETQIEAGSQTITWTYYKDFSDSAGADAGFLDEVSFVPDNPPVITFNPIDQVNYPGYPVNLLADATSNPTATWQWYKVGTGLIPGASSRYYAPTNFGTASVAGSYFATASNPAGSINTRTAVVTFVSAPLAPDWSKAINAQLTGNFDEPRTNYGIACLVDASGNIYSANSFTGTNDFGSGWFSSGPGRFGSGLFKYTTNGSAIWGRAITNNGNGNSYPQCLARAPGDGVFMSGVFLGTNGLGTNILQDTAGASVYLIRFDSAGNVLWVRTFGGTNGVFQSYHQLVSDPNGNVTISALGNNFVNFGTTNIVLNGQRAVLAQYDANGNVRWISKPSGWVHYMTYAAGRIYAAFGAAETNYIGGVTNTTDRKFAMAALNATNGEAFWLQGIGSLSGENNPLGMSDDNPTISVSSSNVFVTGSGWGSNAVFGVFSVSWPTPNGQYFARYDTNGNAQLAVGFGGTNVWPWAAVADASGNVYVTGDFDGYATFGNKTIGGPRYGTIQNGFYGQLFLAKFDRDGTPLWVRQSQTQWPTSHVNVRDLSLAADGVWVCGFVNYTGNFGTHQVNGPVTCIGSPFCTLNYHLGGVLAKVTESAATAPALPVTLLNPQHPGSNFQFQFLSQTGKTNTVQSRTNLVLGTWVNRTNILGDGTTKTVTLPVGSASQEFFRVSTQ